MIRLYLAYSYGYDRLPTSTGLPVLRGISDMLRRLGLCFVFISMATLPVTAQDVRITPDVAARTITLNGATIVIDRIQDSENRLEGEFTRTSRACPPFCITPMTIAPGVATIGELEVMDFLEKQAASGAGLLLDSRLPEFFANGSIPGAVNLMSDNHLGRCRQPPWPVGLNGRRACPFGGQPHRPD